MRSISCPKRGIGDKTLRDLREYCVGNGYSLLEGIDKDGEIEVQVQEQVIEELKLHFRPEFLNRLDETIMFKPLAKEEVGKIVDLLIKDLKIRLQEKELGLIVTDSAKNMVIEHGYNPIYGARPLKRYLQKNIDTLVAKTILSGDVLSGDTITIDVIDGMLVAK